MAPAALKAIGKNIGASNSKAIKVKVKKIWQAAFL